MTATHRITLSPSVPDSHADELARRVYFVSEDILDFSLVRSSGGVEAVDVVVPDGTAADGIARRLRSVAADDVLAHRRQAPKVVWRSTVSGQASDVFGELVRRGAAFEAGEGQIAVGEPVLSLMDRLDDLLRDLVEPVHQRVSLSDAHSHGRPAALRLFRVVPAADDVRVATARRRGRLPGFPRRPRVGGIAHRRAARPRGRL
jgi:hypothetical protein